MKRLIFRLARLIRIAPQLISTWLVVRKPSPYFDSQYYAESNPHIPGKHSIHILHYVLFGENRGFSPNRFFDPAYYAAENGLGDQTNGSSFAHYLTRGAPDKSRIGKLFDPAYYADRYPDFSDVYSHPMLHFQEQGVFTGNYTCAEIENLAKKPKISIITPIYNTDSILLKRCIQSVLYQAYPHWELCLVDDGSSRPGLHEELAKYEALDERIKLYTLKENLGISKASEQGLKLSMGEYIAFLDHDDELHTDALYEFVNEINQHDPDVMYSDEELISESNRSLGIMYKPDFNPALLLNHNYITHFVMVRARLLEQISPFPAGSDGAQDHDLLLKVTEISDKIRHIPLNLYKWRTSETSTSANADQKPYAIEASRLAVKHALERRNIDARIEAGKANFFHDIYAAVKGEPSYEIIITPSLETLNNTEALKKLVANCTWKNAELILILPSEFDTTKQYTTLQNQENITLHPQHEQQSPFEAMNQFALNSSAEFIAFIGQNVIPENNQWIPTLAGYAQLDAAGLTGGNSLGKIPAPECKINSSCPNPAFKEATYYKNFLLHGSRCLSGQECTQNTTFISSAFCMIRRETFQAMSGFDCNTYPELMYDLDLSLKLLSNGFINTYVSFCKATTAYEHIKPEKDAYANEKRVFQETWKEVLTSGDPQHSLPYLLKCTSLSHPEWLQWYAHLN